MKRQRNEEFSSNSKIIHELESFLQTEANVEVSAIRQNEDFITSSGEELMAILKKSQQHTHHQLQEADDNEFNTEMTGYQLILAKKISMIDEERQIDVFNQLMDVMEADIQFTKEKKLAKN